MALDLSTIEGYREDMTAEEKLALLDKYEAPKADYSGYVKKEDFDKAAHDAAEYKRQLKAKSSEEEQKAQEQLEAQKKMQEELDTLRLEKQISSHTAEYLKLGFSDETAGKAAGALAKGDTAELFKVYGEHYKGLEAKLKDAKMGSTPRPSGGESGNTVEQAQMNKMRAAMGLPTIK